MLKTFKLFFTTTLICLLSISASAQSDEVQKIFPKPQCNVENSLETLTEALDDESIIKSEHRAPLGGDLPWPGVDGKWDELKNWKNIKEGILVNVKPKFKQVKQGQYETESLEVYFYSICDVNHLKVGEKPSARAQLSLSTRDLRPQKVNGDGNIPAKSDFYQLRVMGLQENPDEDFQIKVTPVKLGGVQKIHIVIYKKDLLSGEIIEINHNFYLEKANGLPKEP